MASFALFALLVLSSVSGKSSTCGSCPREQIKGSVYLDFFGAAPFGGIYADMDISVGSFQMSNSSGWIDSAVTERKTYDFTTDISPNSFKVLLSFRNAFADVYTSLYEDHFSITLSIPGCRLKVTVDGKELDWNDPTKHWVELNRQQNFAGCAYLSAGDIPSEIKLVITGVISIEGQPFPFLDEEPEMDFVFEVDVRLDTEEDAPPFGHGGRPSVGNDASGLNSSFATFFLGEVSSGGSAGSVTWQPENSGSATSINSVQFPSENNSYVHVLEVSPDWKQLYQDGYGLFDIQADQDSLMLKIYRTENSLNQNAQGAYEPPSEPDKTFFVQQNSPTEYTVQRSENGELLDHATITENFEEQNQILTRLDHLAGRKDVFENTFPSWFERVHRRRIYKASAEEEKLLYDLESHYASISQSWKKLREIVDVDGENLVTEWTYDLNGREHTVIYPDGYWEKYEYESTSSRITRTWSPFKNSPTHPDNATDTNCRLKLSTYTWTWQIPGISVPALASQTHSILGQTVLTKEINYSHTTLNGISVEVQTTTTTPAGSPALTEVARFLTYNGTPALTGRIHSQEYADGTMRSLTYETGDFDEQTFSFTPGSGGSHLQITETEGTKISPKGLPHRTLRKVRVENINGRILLANELVYTGNDTWEHLSSEQNSYDGKGNLIESKKNGALVYAAEYEDSRLMRESNASGVETRYSYDFKKRLSSRKIVGIPQHTVTTNRNHTVLLPEIPDRLTSYQYDVLDRIVVETQGENPDAVNEYFEYSIAGDLTGVEREDGLKTTYVSSNGGRTRTTTLPNASTLVSERYLDRSPRSETGSSVVSTYFEYGVWTQNDSERNPGTTWTRTTLGSENSARHTLETFDGLGRMLRSELPEKNGQIYAKNQIFNSAGQQIRTEIEPSGGPGAWIYEYDSLGLLTRQGLDMDGTGSLTNQSADRVYEFDQSYEKVDDEWWLAARTKEYFTEIDTLPTVIKTERQKLTGLTENQLSEQVITDVLDRKTTVREFVHQDSALLHRTTDAPGSFILAEEYIRNGLLQAKNTIRVAKPSRYFYDSLGREILRIDPRMDLQISTSYHPDSFRVASVNRGNIDSAVYEYYPPGSGVNTGMLKSISQNSLKTFYSWTPRGELQREWGSIHPREYQYDLFGSLSALRTYRSQTNINYHTWPSAPIALTGETFWNYDPSHGYLIAKTDAHQNEVIYNYDPWNRLSTRVWARGVVTSYDYNSADQETGRTYSDATPPTTTIYNRRGFRHSVSDVTGLRVFTYTPDGQIKTDQSGFGLWPVNREFGGEENNPNLTKLRKGRLKISPSGHYSYSIGSGVLVSINSFVGSGWDYIYAENSTIVTGLSDSLMGVANIYMQYDILGRLEEISMDNPLVGDSSILFGYNSSGLLASLHFNEDDYWQFHYNGRGEVKEAVYNLSSQSPFSPFESFQYWYDDIGNRKEMLVNSSLTSYTTNNLNQYDAITTPGGTKGLIYDADGNLLSDGRWIYTWDAENQLVSMTSIPLEHSASQLLFQYDSDGRRISKSLAFWDGSDFTTSGGVTWYAYDGWNLIAEYQVNAGEPVPIKRYYWGLDLADQKTGEPFSAAGGVGGLFAVEDLVNDVIYYPLYDHNGNVIGLMERDETFGEVVATYRYDAYGNRIKFTSAWNQVTSTTNPFQFSTKYLDNETGLYYYGFRYYNPETGRWLNRDPIEERGGINLYAFCSNDSVNRFDSLGLFSYAEAVVWFYNNAGETKIIAFSEVDNGIHPSEFPDWNEKLNSIRGKNITLAINMTSLPQNVGGGPGRITFQLRGSIKSDACKWKLEDGSIKANDEMFDFNKLPWGVRKLHNEVFTRVGGAIGHATGGRDFFMKFYGERKVNYEGVWK